MVGKSDAPKSSLSSLYKIFKRRNIRSFSERVVNVELLPLMIHEALRPHLDPADPVRLILLAPSQSVMADQQDKNWWYQKFLPWTITPDTVLALTGQRLLAVISDNPEEPPTVLITPLADILYLESATILLRSWFEWVWVREGKLEHTRVYFNSVSRGLFQEMTDNIRQLIYSDHPLSSSMGEQKLDLLVNMPYKFSNLIPRYLLLPDERMQAAVFRPSVKNTKLSPLRRQILSQMAIVRTDKTLIFTQEDPNSNENTYGLITQFCPVQYIRSASLAETDAGMELAVSLSLQGAECEFRRPFQRTARDAVREVVGYWMG